MLPRKNRLRRKTVFKALRARGEKFSNEFFASLFFEKNFHPQFLSTVVVPKKKVAKAVDRNKLKRRFRAAILQNLKTAPPFCVIFFPTQKCFDCDFAKLSREVEKFFRKLENSKVKNLKPRKNEILVRNFFAAKWVRNFWKKWISKLWKRNFKKRSRF